MTSPPTPPGMAKLKNIPIRLNLKTCQGLALIPWEEIRARQRSLPRNRFKVINTKPSAAKPGLRRFLSAVKFNFPDWISQNIIPAARAIFNDWTRSFFVCRIMAQSYLKTTGNSIEKWPWWGFMTNWAKCRVRLRYPKVYDINVDSFRRSSWYQLFYPAEAAHVCGQYHVSNCPSNSAKFSASHCKLTRSSAAIKWALLG